MEVSKTENIKSFTAIDFETAQGHRWSICQVGLVRVVNGEIVAQMDLLIQPPYNYYWQGFVDIHGIDWVKTKYAPTFEEAWHLVKSFIQGQHVVAHNSAFDFTCLEQTLDWYGIEQPQFEGHCTYKIFGKGLSKLCEEKGIELQHHNALSDALACSTLFLEYLRDRNE